MITSTFSVSKQTKQTTESTQNMNRIVAKVKEITPAFAERVLSQMNERIENGKFINRKIVNRRVAIYAKAMKEGKWIPTHQGIAFDTDGNLLDGQHRLWAVKVAGIPVRMMVTTGISSNNGIIAMDTIDKGHPRTTQQSLVISHGYSVTDARIHAVVCRKIASFCIRDSMTFTIDQCLQMIELYGKHIKAIMACSNNIQRVNSDALAMICFFHASHPSDAIEFATAFMHLENLKLGTPAWHLAKHMRDWRPLGGKSTGSAHRSTMLSAANMLYHHTRGVNPIKCQPSASALEWLIEQQPENVKKVIEISSITAYEKHDRVREEKA